MQKVARHRRISRRREIGGASRPLSALLNESLGREVKCDTSQFLNAALHGTLAIDHPRQFFFSPTFSDARSRQARALAHNLETQPEQHTLMATPPVDRLKQQTGPTGGRGPTHPRQLPCCKNFELICRSVSSHRTETQQKVNFRRMARPTEWSLSARSHTHRHRD